VVNLDLPWNPARLEQRIARAWRKNQSRVVDVVNLVTENSIEHNMLHLLAQKQALADGVLDGAADLKAVRMPSGRRAFVERMAAVLTPVAIEAATERDVSPPHSIASAADTKREHIAVGDDLAARLGDRLLLLEARRGEDGRERLLAVIDGDIDEARRERTRLEAAMPEGSPPEIEVLDHATYATIDRLVAAGLVRMTNEGRHELVRSPRLAAAAADRGTERMRECTEILSGAERKMRMAQHLLQGGFTEEATPALNECLELAARARAVMTGTASSGETVGPESENLPNGLAPDPAPRSERIAAITVAVERALADVRLSLGA
jgi:hypothetical protein